MYCTAHLIYGCSWIWLNAQSVCTVQDGKKFYGLEYLQSDQNMGSHTGLGTNYTFLN